MAWKEWERVEGFDFDHLIYEKKDRVEGGKVARVTFNRPERLNSFTDHTVDEMVEAFDDASNDPLVGVVILTGAGDRAFSAGGDIKWEGVRTRAQFFMDEPLNRIIRFCRKPVIAVVKGYAIGGGNHLAYTCDFTIAAENAVFGQNGPVVASPADSYFVRYASSVVGPKKAREMWMLCRKYDAAQALEMGLVNTVVPLNEVDAEADRWAEEILTKNPTCIEILKATFDSEVDEMSGSIRRFVQMMAPQFPLGPEVQEAQTAFWEKREPDFWKFRDPERVVEGQAAR
ncbi:enoyl-CoA hydratase-related protein [Diaminobutyricimonas sp. LJ205]|uniref:enoyl-CoA hydratase-related protein n=1 Tax=Diaminobutyricimonas sp. LJ205 TaxID=2683590 RepID=UPI0012F47B75|nr:enoyl-CoA hydratase-related protein [Diaminobutyricimonas sp. LJ205]